MHTFAGDYANTSMESCDFDNTETSTSESFTMDPLTWRQISEESPDGDDSFVGPTLVFAPAPISAVSVRVAERIRSSRLMCWTVLDFPV